MAFHSMHPDMGLANDYVHGVLTSSKNVVELKSQLKRALQIEVPGETNISEDEIDEVISDDLERWASELEEGEISQEQYNEEIQKSSNRRLVRMEMIEAEHGVSISEALGACEVLAALLGYPTKSFAESLSFGDAAVNKQLNHISSTYDTRKLVELVPLAEDTVRNFMDEKVMKLLGLEDRQDRNGWLESLSELLENLGGIKGDGGIKN